MSLLTQASLVLTPNAYKANKLYSIIPSSGSGDMVTTRATTATRVNSSGVIESVATGIPRLDYTGSVPSILLEPQRTNLILRSQDFSNVIWSKNSTTILSTNNIAPNGTLTATRLGITDTINPTLQQIITGTIGLQYASSFWVRRVSGTSQIFLRCGDVSPVQNINLTSDWQLFSYSAISTTTTVRCSIGFLSPVVGTDIIEIWGSQLEQGAYATSYIPTTTSTVTRNQDLISKTNLYTNNFITSAGGTWFTELTNNFILTRDTGGQFGIGTTSEISLGSALTIRRDSGTGRLLIVKYISASGTPIYTTLTDTIKVAIKWNGTTADVFVNGVKVVTSTLFTTTAMEFIQGNTSDVPKYIKSFILFPTPLTDAEMASLTTL